MTPELETKAFLKDASNNSRKLLMISISVLLITLLLILVFKLNASRSESADATDKQKLSLQGKDIPTLNLGHYALWTVDEEGSYHFFKRFNFYQGQLVSLDGTELTIWEEQTPATISKFVVTIEREGDRDEIPNSVIFLQGAPVDGEAILRQELVAQDQARASFILASPSDGNAQVNEQSGIWFVKPNFKESGLELPVLALGNWIWEARVEESAGHYLVIGRFTHNQGYDDFDDYAANEGNALAFPGQDFFRNLPDGLTGPLNLANGKYRVLISLEPHLSEGDFTGDEVFMPILTADIPIGQEVHESVQLQLAQSAIELSIRVL